MQNPQSRRPSLFPVLFFLLGLLSLAGVFLFLPKLLQPQSYHQFAGSPVHTIWSSLVFIPLGIWGMAAARAVERNRGRFLWLIFFASVIFVGVGSAYYHLEPNDFRLMIDRLPIAVALMAIISLLFGEEAGAVWGTRLFFPLAGLGILIVLGWLAGETRGEGDLRLYAWLHLFALLALLLFLFRPIGTKKRILLSAAGLLFAISKILEYYDHQIFQRFPLSGHTLKHLAGAAAVCCLILYCRNSAGGPGKSMQIRSLNRRLSDADRSRR